MADCRFLGAALWYAHGMRLRQVLQGCSSGQLARIAAAWSLEIEAGTLRRELVELIAARLEAAVSEPLFWQSRPPGERRILGALVRAGGRHELDLLARRLITRPAGDAYDAAMRAFHATVTTLVEGGLLYRQFEADEQRQGVYLVLPEELRAGAQVLADDPRVAGVESGAAQPAAVARCRVADDLFVLASALRREVWNAPSRVLAGQPPRSVGQILGRLRARSGAGPGQPVQRWRFLLWLAQRAGWISRDAFPRPHDDLVDRLLRDAAVLPARALSAGPARPEGGASAPADAAHRSRRLQADALQLLSEQPADAWVEAASLADWLAAQLADRPDAGGARPLRPDQVRRTVARWLAGRWFWLGLVTWGRTAEPWTLVQPTPELRGLVSGRPEGETPIAPRPCLATDDLALTAPPGADLAALYRVEPYLHYVGADEGGRRYRLTPPSLERAERAGGSSEVLLQLLANLTGDAVPTSWGVSIDRWTRDEGRLRLTAGLILSAGDPALLAEALGVPAAADGVAELLSPTQARVAGAALPSLLAELAAAGLPVDIDPGIRAEPAQPGRAAALSGSAAEAAWMGLEIARRVAPEVVDGQRDLTATRLQLEAVLSVARLEALGRRVTSILATAADRKKARTRRRVV
ncbi:MAG: helicase-associated domain-containing protein [Chloroflexi bacterium]|nr:helicase-associated domain-containing protein [Chloroflexota bacterium]